MPVPHSAIELVVDKENKPGPAIVLDVASSSGKSKILIEVLLAAIVSRPHGPTFIFSCLEAIFRPFVSALRKTVYWANVVLVVTVTVPSVATFTLAVSLYGIVRTESLYRP